MENQVDYQYTRVPSVYESRLMQIQIWLHSFQTGGSNKEEWYVTFLRSSLREWLVFVAFFKFTVSLEVHLCWYYQTKQLISLKCQDVVHLCYIFLVKFLQWQTIFCKLCGKNRNSWGFSTVFQRKLNAMASLKIIQY